MTLRWAAALVVAALAAGCSGDDPPNVAEGITLPAVTAVLPSATVLPPTTPAPSTTSTTLPARVRGARVGTTPAPTSSAAPTTVASAPCDLVTVEADIGPAGDGYQFVDLRCAGGWATVIAQTLQPNLATDEVLVLVTDAGHWTVAAGGGDTTCRSAGVPADLADPLGCSRWA